MAGILSSTLDFGLASLAKRDRMAKSVMMFANSKSTNRIEAKRFYQFVTSEESLIQAARKYYRIPLRADIDRKQLPDRMNAPFVRMPIDWGLLRKQGNDWLRYWDTEIRGRGK